MFFNMEVLNNKIAILGWYLKIEEVKTLFVNARQPEFHPKNSNKKPDVVAYMSNFSTPKKRWDVEAEKLLRHLCVKPRISC